MTLQRFTLATITPQTVTSAAAGEKRWQRSTLATITPLTVTSDTAGEKTCSRIQVKTAVWNAPRATENHAAAALVDRCKVATKRSPVANCKTQRLLI